MKRKPRWNPLKEDGTDSPATIPLQRQDLPCKEIQTAKNSDTSSRPSIHLALPRRLDPQPPHPPHLRLQPPRQPPPPRARQPRQPDRPRANPKRHLISVGRVLALKELRPDHAAHLPHAILESQPKRRARRALERRATPRPERNEPDAVEQRPQHARRVDRALRADRRQEDEEGQLERVDQQEERRPRQPRPLEEPPREDDGHDRPNRGRDVEQLVARQAREPQVRRDGRQLPLQRVPREVGQELREHEGVHARVAHGGGDFLGREGRVGCLGGVGREARFEVLLLARREPGAGARGFGVVGQDEVDDAGEEDGEEAFEEVDPGEA